MNTTYYRTIDQVYARTPAGEQWFTTAFLRSLRNGDSPTRHNRDDAILSAVLWGVLRMPTAKGKAKERKKADWKGFVNCELDAQQWKAFDAIDPEKFDFWGKFNGLIDAGYKISFGYLDANNAVSCSLYQQYADMPAPGMTLSAFAETSAEAFMIVAYKHFNILEGNWGEARKMTKRQRG